ncbi:XRE family transcriptional regulator [Shimia sp.]|uniref:XRE family transcriptional regulator n=1 Tax=Shimia sp. TaxID=1954381 RepID=UPI003B8DD65D
MYVFNILKKSRMLHDKIRLAISDRGHTISSAAKACDISYRTLHSAVNERRDIGVSILQRLSAGLDIDFGHWSDRTPQIKLSEQRDRNKEIDFLLSEIRHRADQYFRQASYRSEGLTLNAFLDWWCVNGGRLEGFEQLSPKLDIFEPPDTLNSLIQPAAIGNESLATRYFKSEHVDHLRQTLRGFSDAFSQKLVGAHLEALEKGEPVISHPSMDEPLRDGQRFTGQYRRVLAPVTLNGRKMIVNYSEDVGTTTLSLKEP